jgi:flagellar basal-body rod modification protein FlgD
MAAATGIWTQQHAAAQPLLGAHPAPLAGPGDSNSGNNDNSDSNSATISANDFLTLLVTEMQNQDPTDDTDPNEYIDQLVQVNSLEQLIDINQNLSTVLGISDNSTSADSASAQVSPAAAGLTSSTSTGAPAVVHPAAHKTSALGQMQSEAGARAASGPALSVNAAHGRAAPRTTPGNLGIPSAQPAARRVAEALGGKSPAP